MTAAFILGINMFIAALFGVAFAVVARSNPVARGAGWLAAGYALGIVDVMLEFIMRWTEHPTPVITGIFYTYLAALTCGLVGVAKYYRTGPQTRPIMVVWVLAGMLTPAMLMLPYGTGARTLLYHLPYFTMQVLMTLIVIRSGRRMLLDRLLVFVSSAAALSYLVKPLIAWQIGGADTPRNYLASDYAAISQSVGSVILIALALVLLLVMMRDMTIEMIARSETDPLSGLRNRRGFEVHGEEMVADAVHSCTPLTLVTVDIDRFKTINDRFGHPVGDKVIIAVAELLSSATGEGDLVARLGGEEFALVLAGQEIQQAARSAELLRQRVQTELSQAVGHAQVVSASFGLAQLSPDEALSSLARRSDLALYEAKNTGRNKVSLAPFEPAAPQPAPPVLATRKVAA
ncbi:GGDEF domain-containing protein [Qipengyuania sp. SS22]|uniref:GGDEF domain-containing protein n=1 Tax=Qipengyuania sp. SS22 TaxID=2979461 RepID=UPI0021E5C1F7|nr:GGDEF domain-containing protein [Qipengyuania sp. SS22]UYH55566.1 GGDEF domain-containing protein [Qipengyuania sp. SS22]